MIQAIGPAATAMPYCYSCPCTYSFTIHLAPHASFGPPAPYWTYSQFGVNNTLIWPFMEKEAMVNWKAVHIWTMYSSWPVWDVSAFFVYCCICVDALYWLLGWVLWVQTDTQQWPARVDYNNKRDLLFAITSHAWQGMLIIIMRYVLTSWSVWIPMGFSFGCYMRCYSVRCWLK